MASSERPPAWAYRMLRRNLPPGTAGETILGDLQEEYAARRPGLGRGLWYAMVAVKMVCGYHLARRHLGNRPSSIVGAVAQDVRHAARGLARQPSYAITAILTLALGIGASTAAFSIVHGSLLRPLPYRDPDRLVRLYGWWKESSTDSHNSMSAVNFRDLRRRADGFEALAGYQHWWFNLSSIDGSSTNLPPTRVSGLRAEPGLVPLLGIPPQLGRTFADADAAPGAPPTVLIGDALWRSRFGGDPAIVGTRIRLDLVDRTVIGVLPPAFAFLRNPQVIIPLRLDDDTFPRRRQRTIDGIGLLKPDVTTEAGIAELQSIYAGLEEEYPEDNTGWSVAGLGEHEWRVRRGRSQLLLVSGAVALVLLIACVNVAGLVLVRAEARQHELGVRAALGAGRLRLARLFVTESLLVSLAGGLLGALLCRWLVDLAVSAYAASIPRAEEIVVDVRALAFAVGLSVVSGLIVSLFPSWHLRGNGPHDALRQGGRGASTRTAPARHALVVVEVALAVILVAGAGLMIHTVWRLNRVDLGMNGRLLTFALGLPAERYATPADMSGFWDLLVGELESIPGVEAAGLTSRRPLSGGTNGTLALSGEVGDEPSVEMLVELRAVTPGYFPATGVRLVSGRMLTVADRQSGGGVLVNEEFVRRRLGDRDPLREALVPTWAAQAWPIVGVVADTRDFGPTEGPRPTAYWMVGADPHGINAYLTAAVRTSGPPRDLLPPIVERLARLDPDLPLVDIFTLDEIAASTLGSGRRSLLSLLSTFAGIALFLGALGIYGVVSFAVARRTRELGVRMALGATRGNVLGLVLGHGVRLAALGVALGLFGALLTGRLLAGLLFEVSPADPLSLAAVAGLFLAVAVFACWVPARRASHVAVVEALRRG